MCANTTGTYTSSPIFFSFLLSKHNTQLPIALSFFLAPVHSGLCFQYKIHWNWCMQESSAVSQKLAQFCIVSSVAYIYHQVHNVNTIIIKRKMQPNLCSYLYTYITNVEWAKNKIENALRCKWLFAPFPLESNVHMQATAPIKCSRLHAAHVSQLPLSAPYNAPRRKYDTITFILCVVLLATTKIYAILYKFIYIKFGIKYMFFANRLADNAARFHSLFI